MLSAQTILSSQLETQHDIKNFLTSKTIQNPNAAGTPLLAGPFFIFTATRRIHIIHSSRLGLGLLLAAGGLRLADRLGAPGSSQRDPSPALAPNNSIKNFELRDCPSSRSYLLKDLLASLQSCL